MADLYALKKKKGESLRVYMNRFWDMYDVVAGPPQGKVDAFKFGLPDDPQLFDSLILDPPTTTQALAERTEKYILLEESRIRLLGGGSTAPNPQSASENRNNQPSGGRGSAQSRLSGRQDNRNTQ